MSCYPGCTRHEEGKAAQNILGTFHFLKINRYEAVDVSNLEFNLAGAYWLWQSLGNWLYRTYHCLDER